VASNPPESRGPTRNWIGLRFSCHGAYLRVVVPPEGRKITARCPVCGREADVSSDPEGSDRRFFEIDP